MSSVRASMNGQGARASLVLWVGAALFAVELLLWYLHTHPLPWTLARHWFDLDMEDSIPVWFSSTQLFAVALVTVYCAWKERTGKWLPVSGLLLLLSLEETAGFHEAIGDWLGAHVSTPVVFPIGATCFLVAFLQHATTLSSLKPRQ